MKVLPKIKYSRFLFLLLTFVAAYFIFQERNYSPVHSFLLSLGYLGTFAAGIGFAFGFTAAPATAVLLVIAKDQNILLAGLIAGFGALVSDLMIFKFIRFTFAGEIKCLSKEKMVRRLNRRIPKMVRKYVLPVFAGFIIASPLPDELGVSLLAASKTLSTRVFSIISYLLNTAGIFVILALGRQI